MDILEKIVGYKTREIEVRRNITPLRVLESSPLMKKRPKTFSEYLVSEGSSGIIAEFKRRSPSKGIINSSSKVGEVCKGYFEHGASAISVLTDKEFFGGELTDLIEVEGKFEIPFLQKDFIISEYQIVEARAAGADAVLLIASILGRSRIKSLSSCATNMGMECILEVHSENELESVIGIDGIIGVNNRNLGTFKTDIQNSVLLAPTLENRKVKISESGIEKPEDIVFLKEHGYNAFLIGEQFMKSSDPVASFRDFINKLNKLS